jgi:tetratricopeptide (TPR) repeat protein
MSEAKSARPKWILALVLGIVGVVILLGGAYAAGGFILPAAIQSGYQGKNCDSVLQLGGLYARFYPANTETSKLVSECALYTLAVHQEEQKAWQEAYNSYKVYLGTYPNGIFVREAREHSALALMGLAEMQQEQKKYTEALGTLNMVMQAYTDTPSAAQSAVRIGETYLAWGTDLRATKDFSGAEKVLKEFKNWAQDHNQAESVKAAKDALAQTYQAWGTDLRTAGDFAGAENTFTRLQNWAQDNQLADSVKTAKHELAQTYLAWAVGLQSQKKFPEAQARLEQVIATDPESQAAAGPAAQAKAALPALHTEWGNTLIAQNDFAGGIDQLKNALKLTEAKDQPAAKEVVVKAYLQWAASLVKAEDYLLALDKIKLAEGDPGTEAAKKDLETARADTYLAFSNSAGRQAQQAMRDAVKALCEKNKKPDLPIFGLDKTNIRAGLFGVDAKLPENVAATTPGALHYVACIEAVLKPVETRTFYWAVLVREKTDWNVTLRAMDTATNKATTVLEGGTPPPLPQITRANYISILTSPYQHFPGSLPDVVDLANWLLTFLK